MWPNLVLIPGPLALESNALLTTLSGRAQGPIVLAVGAGVGHVLSIGSQTPRPLHERQRLEGQTRLSA